MIYTLSQLSEDLMARMGEAPVGVSPPSEWGDMTLASQVRRKAAALLPYVGKQLIMSAALPQLGGAEHHVGDTTMRKMECGLYGADIALPEDVARIVSVKMRSWSREVQEIAEPGSGGYECQWSEEPGIAGSAERPKGYLLHGGGGLALRAIGSESPDDTPEHLLLWRQPKVDIEGKFRFPASIYPELIEKLSAEI